MICTWDIIEPVAAITRTQAPNRRPTPEISSMLKLGLVVSLAASAATADSTEMVLPANTVNAVAKIRVAVKPSPTALRRPPGKEGRGPVDFARARSAEKLANSFRAYFKPSTHIDDSSDDEFVFD